MPVENKNPWQTISTREIYKNPWIRVREDEVVRPDGKTGIYGVVEIRPSVGVIAVTSDRRIALVGQWRYTLNKYSWEIPTGVSVEGEYPLDAAKRELREETGLEGASWEALGTIDNCNGVTTDVAHLFLATAHSAGHADPDPEEQLVLKWIELSNAVEMVVKGEITESVSVAGILKAHLKLRSSIVSTPAKH
jgi:8-oxo-dGTP pyrophosphatase MutT (NUDIX family)